jgi:hypothetical protein
MSLCVVAFWAICAEWSVPDGQQLMNAAQFLHHPLAVPLLLALLGISVTGGMFVVPLYAFLTTFVDKAQTARTIAANNIVNSGAMVFGALLAMGLSAAGVGIVRQLLLSAVLCLVSAWLGWRLYRAECRHCAAE